MQIPIGSSGFPTVSATQLRVYGSGGFRLNQQEEARGCPRQYRAKYIDHVVPEGQDRGYALSYGSLIHDVLYRMEQDGLTPDEALEQCFPVDGDPAMWKEAQNDLTRYLERGASPTDKYGTLAVEQDLSAELYVDEEFGPVYYRGIVDWLGLDLNDPNTLHLVDYKTNRSPPARDDIMGDVQLKAYHWLVRQNAHRYGAVDPAIVVHLDLVKWREIEVRFSDDDIEDWRGWAIAVCRRILRDDDADPVLNPGCGYCPVQSDCPAFLGLPATGRQILTGARGGDLAARYAWRKEAAEVRLLLEKAIKAVDSDVTAEVERVGRLVLRDVQFTHEPDWKDEIDLRALHAAMGDSFYQVASVAKYRIKEMTRGWPASVLAGVLQAITREPSGMKITTRKVPT